MVNVDAKTCHTKHQALNVQHKIKTSGFQTRASDLILELKFLVFVGAPTKTNKRSSRRDAGQVYLG